ncbi:retrovirus-related pol polyprotein from transposon TNT 1-94 [Tanacetum coccineum]
MQQPIANLEGHYRPSAAMNMTFALMAKAFKLNYSTPTNNNQRISSNPRNRQIAQPGMNLGQDNQMQMVGGNGGNQFRQYAGQNVGNRVVQNAVQNPAARAEGNENGNIGNQIRCYNCRGLGHLARNCTVKPRKRDAAYLQTQLIIAQKEEAGIQLQAEEFDMMAAAAYLDEIEKVNANCILMVIFRQSHLTSGYSDWTMAQPVLGGPVLVYSVRVHGLWLSTHLSHLNFDTINDLARNNLVTGLPKFKYHKVHLCPSCEQGKSKRASHPPKHVPNSKQRLHLLHMDLCGPMRIASINGKRYVLVIVDDYSRYTWVVFLRSKDEAPEEIKTFLKRITVLLQAPVIIDHPLEQVVGEPSRPVLTRNQLKSDDNICMYALTFKRLDVWVLVPLPDHVKPLTLKWLFKNKHDEENTVIQNKTRLVVRGYRQEEGIDFEESFAPVARMESFRIFLGYAAYKSVTVFQMAVKIEFLHGRYKKKFAIRNHDSFDVDNPFDSIFVCMNLLVLVWNMLLDSFPYLDYLKLDHCYLLPISLPVLFVYSHKGSVWMHPSSAAFSFPVAGTKWEAGI